MTPELAATIQTLLVWSLPPLVVAVIVWAAGQAAQAYTYFKLQQPDIAAQIERAADLAVKAAEQNGLVKQFGDLAFDKKQYALYTAQEYLKAQGVPINLSVIDAAIEAKVIELFPQDGAGPEA